MSKKKMQLNRWQYAWIRRLKSGKTRKAIGKLQEKGSQKRCCLGVGAKICGESIVDYYNGNCYNEEDLTDFDKTRNLLHINAGGTFEFEEVSEKWKKKIIERLSGTAGSLVTLNDGGEFSKGYAFSHREIGEFIDENREAVFTKGA